MARDTVGVLGLGYMGARIAAKLLEAGYDVTVWDRKPESRAHLVAQGAAEIGSPHELAQAVDILLVSLTDDDVVREVALGEGGAISGLRAGSVYLECSTVSPATIEDLAAAALKQGATVVDASISGSTPSPVVEDGAAHGRHRRRLGDEACGERDPRRWHAGDRGGDRRRRGAGA